MFRKKEREYLKENINESETNSKEYIIDIYRHINEFKELYEPRTNVIKDEKVNLLADPQSVLNWWKSFFNQVLNVHGFEDIRLTGVHTPELLVLESSLVEVEIAIAKFKSINFWVLLRYRQNKSKQ
jgi:hypothetical protein